jgi:hypothetical protein
MAICVVLVLVALLNHSSSAAPIPEVKATDGRCLEIAKNFNSVIADACTDDEAQSWSVVNTSITHDSTQCLGVQNDSQTNGAKVTAAVCNQNAPGQVWLREGSNFMNPNGGFCLSEPTSNTAQVAVSSCNLLAARQSWATSQSKSKNNQNVVPASCANKTKGQKIACVAAQQWNLWQTQASQHANLLNEYSDGNGYEEWCADFVSYVYRQAGYPLTNGERDGWDEYDANDMQYDGFTTHAADSNYVPQTGDVAFFNYPGGHVEIVLSGGKTPTFVYGDSAIVDPVTGNGTMAANTIQGDDDGISGQVAYYLSPKN